MLQKHEAALLMLLGFSLFSVFLAVLYNAIRRHVFHDADNLDTTFDAGGNVSTSLTAVTIASQLMWPGDILQSATVAVKYGVSGAFWYSTAAAVNIALFPALSFHFKTRAPGAKTYLQVMQARFGKVTHTVFCFYALLINVVILTAICVVGVALIQSLVTDASPEFCLLIIATSCGSYSFIGGLGSTFYVSYFNAVMVFALLAVIIVNVFYLEHDEHRLLGDVGAIYRKIACLQGPEGNAEQSYLTFWSEGGIIWACAGICLTASITFCDQASWQSRIAAKPVQGVYGFLLATFVWFAVPSTIGTATGLTYLALAAENTSLALPIGDIDAGLVTAYVTQLVMGRVGAFLILTMFTMLVMSTGSGEIMAVSSIIVYDIYQPYINPYRRSLPSGSCVLCGEKKTSPNPSKVEAEGPYKSFAMHHVGNRTVETEVTCKCPSVSACVECAEDKAKDKAKAKGGRTKSLRTYTCPHHGDYRLYEDCLVRFKNWVILWVTVFLVPFGLLVHAAGMDLNWVMLSGSIATIPCFPGVVMSLVWVRASAVGLAAGSIGGLVCGISVNLIYASTLDGGLTLLNTSHTHPVLAGCLTSLSVSLILSIVVSLCTHSIHNSDDEDAVWCRLRQINNPLHHWAENYRVEFPNLPAGQEPTFEQLNGVFRKAKVTTIVGSVVSILILVVLIPGTMTALEVLSAAQFRAWFISLQVWCLIMGLVVVIVTPVEEFRSIWKQLSWNMRQKYSPKTNAAFKE